MERPRPESLHLDYLKPENQDVFLRTQIEYPEVAQEYLNQAEGEAWRENLYRYGLEHYSQYKLQQVNHQDYIQRIAADRENFETNIFPNVVNAESELVDRVITYVEGQPDSEIDKAIKRAGLSVLDMDSPTELKALGTLQAVLKDETFNQAVQEQEKTGIKYVGFKNDPDFKNIQQFLENAFGKKLLDKALISEIIYHPVTVVIGVNDVRFNMPNDKYLEWKKSMPQVKMIKGRAESFAVVNANFNVSKKYISLPIDIYSFVDEDPGGFEYFKGVPNKDKIRLYKLGAVAHEVGHSVYDYLVYGDMRKEWERLIQEAGHITHYSKDYADGTRDIKLRPDEEFCEAVRLLVTTPKYLTDKFPKVIEFFNAYFPAIKSGMAELKF